MFPSKKTAAYSLFGDDDEDSDDDLNSTFGETSSVQDPTDVPTLQQAMPPPPPRTHADTPGRTSGVSQKKALLLELQEANALIAKQEAELKSKDEVIKTIEMEKQIEIEKHDELRKSVETPGSRNVCEKQEIKALIREFLTGFDNEDLGPILSLLPSSWRFCCDAKHGDTGKEPGDVIVCMDDMMWTRNEAEIVRIFTSVLVKELHTAIEKECSEEEWEVYRKQVLAIGKGAKGIKIVREQLKHQFFLEDKAQTFDSNPCICNFSDGVVEMQANGSINFRDRKSTDYVTISTGVNGKEWLKPPSELSESQRVWYDKLMDSVTKSGFDPEFRHFMLRSLGFVLFRYADAALSKVFWLLISSSDCGKSTWFRLLVLAAGAYRGFAGRNQLGRNASELCVSSLIANGSRFMILDDAVANDGIDLVTVTSLFTNVGAVPVRTPRTNHVRYVDMTPLLLVAINWKYLPNDAGGAEREKMLMLPEDDCDGRRFMGRFVSNADDVDAEKGRHMINNDFKRVLRDSDPENAQMRGAAACILYNAIKDNPDFEPRTDYPVAIKRARDEKWEKYCERRAIDRKGVGGFNASGSNGSSSSDAAAPQVGPPQRILVASPSDFASVDDAFDAVVASVVAQLVPAAGKLVTLKV
jgi:hypothetical protein